MKFNIIRITIIRKITILCFILHYRYMYYVTYSMLYKNNIL